MNGCENTELKESIQVKRHTRDKFESRLIAALSQIRPH